MLLPLLTVNAQQSKRSTIQSNRDQATSLSQAADTTAEQINEKIKQLESKLANAENLLSQMRQPLTFPGDLGLTFDQADGTAEHLYDEVSLEVRKPGTFSDGVMFFVDNTAQSMYFVQIKFILTFRYS